MAAVTGWIVGFITPTPGGIGVREAVFIGLAGLPLGTGQLWQSCAAWSSSALTPLELLSAGRTSIRQRIPLLRPRLDWKIEQQHSIDRV